ncbi:TPA: hypothetical protein MNC29_003666 [Citrobacter freundii]|uniref:hypothetical protein n=1 Tax=Citrobacter TaxID=544 RepID=UPI00186873F6|nr:MULTISPECIES: hypothetical protein [Citrobacter]EIN8660175.1 hypothetical protein [Citrobacter freundii]MDM3093520.1 hypothetical protein [Citrobacter sp. Cf136]MDT7419681.1 hypothetical protein [Citrobacter freundii]CAD5351273.1 conserved exported protein of unknown function [Citrobacter freundii]HBN5389424.1 hypothetical protein [Citrobacter freundii]
MTKYFAPILSLLIFSSTSMADCNSNSLFCYYTKFGILDQITRSTSGDDYSYLTLNGVNIYKAKTDYMSFMDDDMLDDDMVFFKNNKYFTTKTVITYTLNERCLDRIDYQGFCSISVVLDFSGDKPVISNGFTPDSGNSVIDWVSWGKANAIIVFEDESKFKYMNGHVERIVK